MPQRLPQEQASPLAMPVQPATPPPPQPFQSWRLDYNAGGPGSVCMSEFSERRPMTGSGDAYGRPTNKRDLGHRCYRCRRPFSMLGAEIVSEPASFHGQRFHPECWQSLCGAAGECGERPAAPRRIGSTDEAATCAASSTVAVDAPAAAAAAGTVNRADSDIVTEYAEAWRRENLQGSRARRHSRPMVPRSSVLDGLISYDDGATGEKKIARGFSSAEIEVVTARWAATEITGDAADECAICFSAAGQGPLKLPCGHSFCGECVIPWLRRCALCPMCRGDLRPLLDRDTLGVTRPGASTPQTSSQHCRSSSPRPSLKRGGSATPAPRGNMRRPAEFLETTTVARGPLRIRSLSVSHSGALICGGGGAGSRKVSKEKPASRGA